jgi:formiminotetrahydrofolate cyclodeaminase
VISPRALLDGFVAEGSPAAGSGVAAALVSAMAAAIVRESARRSGAAGAAAQAHKLWKRALPLMEADEVAYREASARLGGSNGDFELGRALDRAAEVPLLIAGVASDVAALAAVVATEADPSARADAVGAAFLAEAATRTAAHLVEINLLTQADDARLSSARSLVASAAESIGALAP